MNLPSFFNLKRLKLESILFENFIDFCILFYLNFKFFYFVRSLPFKPISKLRCFLDINCCLLDMIFDFCHLLQMLIRASNNSVRNDLSESFSNRLIFIGNVLADFFSFNIKNPNVNTLNDFVGNLSLPFSINLDFFLDFPNFFALIILCFFQLNFDIVQ